MTLAAPLSVMGALSAESPSAGNLAAQTGLTSDEARRRLEKFGPNAMPDTALHPLRMALDKFWAPVPWMLEAAIVLELVLGKYVEAAIIAALLVFNAALGLVSGEPRAGDPCRAEVAARADRVGPARRRLENRARRRVGAGRRGEAFARRVVAADVRLTGGEVLLDQSMLTGESIPIEAGAGVQTYAGALVRRGEAVAEVTATGARTKFGRTAELVRTAHVVSSQQKAVLRVVRNLAAFNGVVIVDAGGLCRLSRDAARRDHPPRPDGGSRIDTGRAAGHLHPCGGARRAGPGKAGRPSDAPLRGG